MRYTIKGEYQPIFNLRLRVRHRFSSRSEMDPADVRKFRNWETRWNGRSCSATTTGWASRI